MQSNVRKTPPTALELSHKKIAINIIERGIKILKDWELIDGVTEAMVAAFDCNTSNIVQRRVA